jgi:hypothetical protein
VHNLAHYNLPFHGSAYNNNSMSIRDLTHTQHLLPMLLQLFQYIRGSMDKTLYSRSRVPWFDSILEQFFISTHIRISNIKFIFFSSEMNQL